MVDYCNPLSATQQQEITKQLVVDNSILDVLPELEKGTVSWDLLLIGAISVYTTEQQETQNIHLLKIAFSMYCQS